MAGSPLSGVYPPLTGGAVYEETCEPTDVRQSQQLAAVPLEKEKCGNPGKKRPGKPDRAASDNTGKRERWRDGEREGGKEGGREGRMERGMEGARKRERGRYGSPGRVVSHNPGRKTEK